MACDAGAHYLEKILLDSGERGGAVRVLHLDRDIDHIAAALGCELRTYDVALLM